MMGVGGSGGGMLMPEPPSGGPFGNQQPSLFGESHLLQPSQPSVNSFGEAANIPDAAEKQQKVKKLSFCYVICSRGVTTVEVGIKRPVHTSPTMRIVMRNNACFIRPH